MYRKFFKRAIDIFLVLLASPFILLIIMLVSPFIYFTDKGPVFYNANRIGRNGKIFKMYKLRSMVVDAPDIRLEDGSTYNSVEDSRVTPIGRFLRKTSIDELPQFINILIGDMSLIGPRPDPDTDLYLYDDPQFKNILSVRPGITGWNQAINRNSVGTMDKLMNDIYYVKHLSFRFDCKIFFLTIKTVFTGNNLYRN